MGDVSRSEVVVIPSGSPAVATLSAHAHVSVVLGLRGTTARFDDVRTALRNTELPDRLHRRPARHYSSVNRFSLWLAIAALTKAPVLVVGEQALQGRDGQTAGRLIQEATARHPVIIVSTQSAGWADACRAAPWPRGEDA